MSLESRARTRKNGLISHGLMVQKPDQGLFITDKVQEMSIVLQILVEDFLISDLNTPEHYLYLPSRMKKRIQVSF